ncbi:MAG: TIM barrel protein, partial [Bacilli bacterium]|nr:TIM barrel protein [Bacilli bacterium]
QIHSVDLSNLNEDTIKKFLSYYNELSLVYGKKIKITIHPAEEINSIEIINKSIKILNYITEIIKENNYNFEILLENLNKLKYRISCSIHNVFYIYKKTNIDGITLDFGHYVSDNLNRFSKILNINKIKNIHIHDINNNHIDHYPFYYHNVELDKIFEYLEKIKYHQNIVLECALEYLKGETLEDKIKEYINQIEYIKNRLKKVEDESCYSKM